MNALITFQFGSNNIRIQQDADNQPWFNAQDVCGALELGNPRQALDSHVDEDDLQKLDIIDDLGRTQKANFVNESGLYALIFGCTKEAAKVFKKWVTSEVLPSIRKTGTYQLTPAKPLSPAHCAREALHLMTDTFQALQTLGFDKNAAIISANQYTRKHADIDVLADTGNTHLIAENQTSLYYTPTELGERLSGLSAQKLINYSKLPGCKLNRLGISNRQIPELNTPGYWTPLNGIATARRFNK